MPRQACGPVQSLRWNRDEQVSLLRIRSVKPLGGARVELTLSDGSVVTRDLAPLMVGPIFGPLRDPDRFAEVRAEEGTLVWPNGADLCPDTVIWGGPPPAEGAATTPPAALAS